MSHLVENMFSVKTPPWHNLGKVLDVAPETINEALKLAGLDWEVSLEPLYLASGAQVNRNAVVRQSDKTVLGTVGLGWKPIQNSKAFQPFEPFITSKNATIETAGSLMQGARVWMLAKLNRPDSVIVPKADDKVAKHLLVAMGHDGTLAFRIGYTPIRVVCNNTLSVALREGASTHIRITHHVNASSIIDTLTSKIDEIDAKFEETAKVFKALAGINISSDKQIKTYIKAVFSQKKEDLGQPVEDDTSLFESLLKKDYTPPSIITTKRKSRVEDDILRLFGCGVGNDLPGVKDTAWALYNAVTQYNTHERGRSEENRLNSLWFGQSGPVAKALPVAIDMFLENVNKYV